MLPPIKLFHRRKSGFDNLRWRPNFLVFLGLPFFVSSKIREIRCFLFPPHMQIRNYFFIFVRWSVGKGDYWLREFNGLKFRQEKKQGEKVKLKSGCGKKNNNSSINNIAQQEGGWGENFSAFHFKFFGKNKVLTPPPSPFPLLSLSEIFV